MGRGLKIPLESQRAGLSPRCAMPVVLWWQCMGSAPVPGVAAQPVAPALQPCHVQAGTRAKAKRSPGSPSDGSRSVPPRPCGSPWPPVLLSPRCLTAAEHSSVLPRGPWPQISRGTGLAATPHGSRLPHSQGAAPGGPVGTRWCSAPRRSAPEGGKLAAWPGLVAARIQHYNTWLRDRHSPGGAGGPAGNQPPLRGSRPPPPSRQQAGAEPCQGDGAGSGRGPWGPGGTVSNGDGAHGGCPHLGLRTGQGAGLCRRWWRQHAVSRGSVAGREPRPCCLLCQGKEMAAAVSRHGPGIRGEAANAAVPRPVGAAWP